MRNRRGSFLLLCIIMMSLMVVIGVSLLLSIQLQNDASTNNQRTLLAQSAAQAGVEHATEMILRDYASTSLSVAADGPTSHAGVEQVRPVSSLDGPYRGPFLAIAGPDRPDWDFNALDSDKDVRQEHPLQRPYVMWNWMDMHTVWDGMSHMVGRGRYYEPNYYNTTLDSTGLPAPTSFVDPAAALPERNQGMFYDEHFQRIQNSDPVAARMAARYRLRYALNVEDLSGLLLANPLSDPNLPQDYRTPPTWVARAADALTTMMVTQCGSDTPTYVWDAAKIAHVFMGRGYGGNVDVDANGFPITFPLMYRYGNQGDSASRWEVYQTWWGSQNLANTLYQSTYVKGEMNGGEPLYVDGNDGNDPYIHALIGPQMSWWNIYYATVQNNSDPWMWVNPLTTAFSLTPFGHAQLAPNDPQTYDPTNRRWYQGRVSTPFSVNVLTAPPWVIDDMLTAYLPPKFKTMSFTTMVFIKWGGLDANGGNIWIWPDNNGLVDGVLSVLPIDPFNPNNNAGLYGRDLLVDTTSPAFAEFPAPTRTGGNSVVAGETIKPDYYLPDPRINPPAPTQPYTGMYPGLAWNGDPTKPGQGSDDAGQYIPTNGLGYGMCTHTWQPFFRMDPPTPSFWGNWYTATTNFPASNLTVQPPAWWPPQAGQDPSTDNNLAYKYTDPDPRKYTYSYWWDIYSAMTMAITTMRASYNSYNNGYFDPTQLFPPGLKEPANFQSVRDLDRQFLASLGESLDMPGRNDPTTAPAWIFNYQYNNGWHLMNPILVPWSPGTSIHTLLGSSVVPNPLQVGNPPQSGMFAADRAAEMERVLNDFRMSFLGSDPEYSDGIDPASHVPNPAMEFRPLDFDGDGVVHCSCYQNPSAVAQDGLASGPTPIINPSAAADAMGRGPKPDPRMYFCVSGHFTVAKSHYYRVISRGELWDNQTKTIVNEATLESALAVDPEGRNPNETQTLFQRWHFDRYQGLMPHVRP